MVQPVCEGARVRAVQAIALVSDLSKLSIVAFDLDARGIGLTADGRLIAQARARRRRRRCVTPCVGRRRSALRTPLLDTARVSRALLMQYAPPHRTVVMRGEGG